MQHAPFPARGRYADGFEPVARTFADALARGAEIGAALSVYQRGVQVVDLWGGLADTTTGRAWERDTRIVVFSVTKGLAAMGMHLLADREVFDWDEPVATYWPELGQRGKHAISVRTLLNHRAGLPYLDVPLSLRDCVDPARAGHVLGALERQAPAWRPDDEQGYHALTYGLYLSELFARLAGEPLGPFLERELFQVVSSDARLGTPASEDSRQATLYVPSTRERLLELARGALLAGDSPELRIMRDAFSRHSLVRRAFTNPSPGPRGLQAYADVAVRRAALAWASATASADGIARAYLPFASDGRFGDARLFSPGSLAPVYRRQSWSRRDLLLKKPLGWSQGFLKEERQTFSPNPESFGHAGMGGALGWCDPTAELCIGYVMNRMDGRVRSPRALALCRSLYECEPLCGS
ncbi:MAG: beta-lactamase family protein [Myxococcales bacterium]|nr:beta-lactamase family protein [Myxococcales bacterium]